jgi:hypothetical protein
MAVHEVDFPFIISTHLHDADSSAVASLAHTVDTSDTEHRDIATALTALTIAVASTRSATASGLPSNPVEFG